MEWRNTSEYLGYRGARAVLRALPYSVAVRTLQGLARVASSCPGLRRDVVARQLREVHPDWSEERRAAVLRELYAHLGLTVAEMVCAEPQALAAAVAVEPGWAALDAAVARGRGVILASAHLGNFELGGRVLAVRYDLLDVIKPQRNPAIDDELLRMRRDHGIATVPMDRSGPVVLRHLRRGGVVSLFVDQDAGASGIRLDFLGRPASTWPGAARVALRTGCDVVPVAAVRRDGAHVLRIGEAIPVTAGPATPEAVAELMGRIVAGVEAFVGENPEQWFWVHRRWKGAHLARVVDAP